jgi:Protein kinase domain
METQGPLSGQTLGGKYLLAELLGEGGFGAVYRGHHLLLDRPQAIKVLHEHYFRKPEFRERFLREAKIVAALDHPHIVHIDDFSMDEQEAKTYLVMPFIGGGTFSEILKRLRQPLPVEQVALYLEQICSALDYAHQRGVVHLDLKPLNLLIRESGDGLLLSDFGLAHFLNQEAVEGGTSLEFGSPHYMAPEHINGQPNKSSDIYALGIILFEMLVGQRPFTGTAPEVMLKHLTKSPPLLRSLRPELPIELEEVLERALAKQAEQRFRSATALLNAFKGALPHVQEQKLKAEMEERQKAEEERARKAEAERLRRAKEEQALRAEIERLQRAEEERVCKAEEKRLQRVKEVQALRIQIEQLQRAKEKCARKAEEERLQKVKEVQALRTQIERLQRNEEERARKIMQLQRAKDEQVRKVEEELLRRVKDEQALRAEIERLRKATPIAATEAVGGAGLVATSTVPHTPSTDQGPSADPNTAKQDSSAPPPHSSLLPQKLPSDEVLKQIYEQIRNGKVTDPQYIRQAARIFEAVARDPEASQKVTFDVERAATNLHKQAEHYEKLYQSGELYSEM